MPTTPDQHRDALSAHADRLARFLRGEISKDSWRPIRLSYGLYYQLDHTSHLQRIKVPGGLLTAAQLEVLAEVAERYDQVLLDCPPSLGNLTRSGLSAARHALVVVEPSALSLRGIGAVADVIDDIWDTQNPHLELTGVVVNRVPPTSSEADRRFDELTRIVGRKAVWQPVVPNRAILNQAIGERRPIHSYGSRSADVAAVFDALAARLRRATR